VSDIAWYSSGAGGEGGAGGGGGAGSAGGGYVLVALFVVGLASLPASLHN